METKTKRQNFDEVFKPEAVARLLKGNKLMFEHNSDGHVAGAPHDAFFGNPARAASRSSSCRRWIW